MSLAAPTAKRGWHPLVGAALVAAPTLLVGLALLGEAQGSEVGGVLGGLTAFLVMGAVAGFAVSGST